MTDLMRIEFPCEPALLRLLLPTIDGIVFIKRPKWPGMFSATKTVAGTEVYIPDDVFYDMVMVEIGPFAATELHRVMTDIANQTTHGAVVEMRWSGDGFPWPFYATYGLIGNSRLEHRARTVEHGLHDLSDAFRKMLGEMLP